MHGSKARCICWAARQCGVQVEDHGHCLAGDVKYAAHRLYTRPGSTTVFRTIFLRLRTPSMLKSSSRESLSVGMTIPVGGIHQRSGNVKATGQCGRSLSCVDASGDAAANLQRTQKADSALAQSAAGCWSASSESSDIGVAGARKPRPDGCRQVSWLAGRVTMRPWRRADRARSIMINNKRCIPTSWR